MKISDNGMRICDGDNVIVALDNIKRGDSVFGVVALEDINRGHKIALSDISAGARIVKYGYVIGTATQQIKKGEHVHTHNVRTNLDGEVEYTYTPSAAPESAPKKGTFMGYDRGNGKVGIRNEVWVIPTVGCIGRVAERVAAKANEMYGDRCDGVFAYHHLYGCSQLGDDALMTQRTLVNMVDHPNASAVLVMGLGCENNNITEFKKALGSWDDSRVRFLNAQDSDDELSDAMKLLDELTEQVSGLRRTPVELSKLALGFKCGGSDGLSGITCNPLLGSLADLMVSYGSSLVLTETSEMFGVEQQLLNNCADRSVFDSMVKMINDFKEYYIDHGQVIYENPSSGNKEGGITTLEDKSTGCIQKAGHTHINAILDYGERISSHGINLVEGPGNDIVAITTLMSAGANMILFTTGRGIPVGSCVPTIKISSNSAMAEKKSAWIDFDAGKLISGESGDAMLRELFDLVISVAEGKKTRNEENGYREISIFKDGVIL